MKKAVHSTSRVHWQMGQALLPEHFYAQEQSLREETNLRFRLAPAPLWGLGSLQWDGFQLLKGILSVQELTLVLQSGTLVDVPGNTTPGFLNLNIAGATKAPVYVHLQSGFDVVALGQGDLAEEGIERIVHKIELSTVPYSPTGAQSFKLAEFECGADGAWSLRPDYVPPLIGVGRSPFFESQLKRMHAIARAFKRLLTAEVEQNYLAGDSQAAAKQCLRGLFNFEAMLSDLDGEIRLHPYDVFRGLRAFYIDACVYRDVVPSVIERAYEHEDLGGCFGALLDALEEQAQIGRQRVPYVELVRKEGMYVGELGKDVRRAKDVFLLVQKPQVATKLELGGVKLASPSRIHVVYERALRGIPYERVESPPFHHGLASNVEFYALSPGMEWDHAVREGSVVLFDVPQLEGTRLYLYWRSE